MALPAGDRAVSAAAEATSAALVAAGRYTATLGKKVGETVTPIGTPQVFRVIPVQQ